MMKRLLPRLGVLGAVLAVLTGCVPVPVMGGLCSPTSDDVTMEQVCANLVAGMGQSSGSSISNDPDAKGWRGTGDVAPPLKELRAWVNQNYPGVVVGGVRKDTLRFHPTGRAIDIMVPVGSLNAKLILDHILNNWGKYYVYNVIHGDYYYTPTKKTAAAALAAAHQDHIHVAVRDEVANMDFGQSFPTETGQTQAAHTENDADTSGSTGADGTWVEVVKHRPTTFMDRNGNSVTFSVEEQERAGDVSLELCKHYWASEHGGDGTGFAPDLSGLGVQNVKGRKGVFTLPLGRMPAPSSRFSPARKNPVDGVVRAHNGTDYPAPTGTPIYAVAAGSVSQSGWRGGCGNSVVIDHGMIDGHHYMSEYCHMVAPSSLRRGERVNAGQAIGAVGSTGRSTGPHLHIGLKIDGIYTNPEPWF